MCDARSDAGTAFQLVEQVIIGAAVLLSHPLSKLTIAASCSFPSGTTSERAAAEHDDDDDDEFLPEPLPHFLTHAFPHGAELV